jgi:hypothetical protein
MYSVRTTVLTGLLLASPAAADFLVEAAPSWRGDSNTSWYHWESFTSASADTGPNFPTSEQYPTGEAILFNFSDGAVVSGDGNIYGFGGALNVHAYAYASADVQQVVANISMHGIELLYDQVMLAWNDGIDGGEEGILFADVSINYWEEVDFGGGLGAIANVSYAFDLSLIGADVREIGVMFQTAAAHSSLDAMAVDLQTVPTPGVLAVLALAGIGMRRRR